MGKEGGCILLGPSQGARLKFEWLPHRRANRWQKLPLEVRKRGANAQLSLEQGRERSNPPGDSGGVGCEG